MSRFFMFTPTLFSFALPRYSCHDRYRAIADAELDIVTSVWHTILAVRVIMVTRTGVLRKEFTQGLKLIGSKLAGNSIGDYHLQRLPRPLVDKAGAGSRVSIRVGYIRLDVIDGRAIHQVSAKHMNDRSLTAGQVYFIYAYAREPKSIRTEWRTRGKHPYPLIAAKTWRTDSEMGCGRIGIGRKLPNEPQIVKILQSTNSLSMAIFWCKNDTTRQYRYHTALSRYAEFRRQRRMEIGNGDYRHQSSM